MEKISIETISSERGGLMIFYGNYKYNFYRKLASGETKWRCRAKGCRAVIYTVGAELLISKMDVHHSHERPDPSSSQKAIVSAAAKREASEEISLPPKRIIQHVLAKAANCSELDVDSINNVKKCIYRQKRKKYPKLPMSCDGTISVLNTVQNDIVTSRGENFLSVNDDNSQIVIFTCDTNLKLLCDCKQIFMDGTFKYCPKFFFCKYLPSMGIATGITSPSFFVF